LSFAQFEREVTGERIRDKIAASKKKGMWMGGNVPLGLGFALWPIKPAKSIILVPKSHLAHRCHFAEGATRGATRGGQIWRRARTRNQQRCVAIVE
jgi:hypothetical protein